MNASPPRGPARSVDLASLPPVARVLLTAAEGIERSRREDVRRCCRAVSPTVESVRRALAILRPRDKDGGWGWFGRELARISS